jgi:TRAP-type mannitol/chloroaromatic compound transport system permease large subunit
MGILLICAPVFVPIILSLGFDKLWFGVLFTINMEMAYITPPFGFNLFYMKGVVPPEISMGDIYRSIVPYVFCQALCLALVMVFPELALWLPRTMMTR